MGSVSVIAVSYHTGPALWLMLESVLAQPEVTQLIIINNGNPSDVSQRLHRLAAVKPMLKILEGQGNIGFAKGCNLGAATASGEYLLFLNPDSILPPGAISRLCDVLTANDQALVVGPRLVHPDGTEQAGSRRNLLTPVTAMVEGLKMYRWMPGYGQRLNLHECPLPERVTEVAVLSGACLFLRRDTYLQLDGMDERYFLHVEDIDFCKRITDAGGKLLFVPDVEVMHFLSTSRVSSLFVEWHKTKGFLKYFSKHPDVGTKAARTLAKTAAITRFTLWALMRPLLACRSTRGHQDRLLGTRRLLWLYNSRWLDRSSVFLQESTPGHIPLSGPVLVTGASSQLGVAIIRRLLHEGVETIALRSQHPLPFWHRKLRWMVANLSQPELPLKGVAPRIVIHAAPIWLLKPAHIHQLAKAGVSRIIAYSSTSIEGKEESTHPGERQTVQKLRQGEADVQLACDVQGISLTIFRPTLIYGFGLDHNVEAIRRFLMRFKFFPLAAPASGKRQPVHVDDLARAALSVISAPASFGRTYALSGGEVLSYREMVSRIATSQKQKPRLLLLARLPEIMDFLARVTGRYGLNGNIARRMNKDLVFSHQDAFEDFGYAPRAFDPMMEPFPWP